MPNVHILGGSGSGTTTLGAALATELGIPHFDTDDFYWLATVPRFRAKRTMPERLELLEASLDRSATWTLSGSLYGWGDPLVPRFTLVVYLDVPGPVRLARLRTRESARHGTAAIAPGGELHGAHTAFLDWAASYDDPAFSGRSRINHERWLTQLPCDVVRLDGEASTETLVASVVERVYRRRE